MAEKRDAPVLPVAELDGAELLARRMDAPMAGLGVLFAVLVLVETVSRPAGRVGAWLAVASWVLWAVFVAEFGLRLVIAEDRWRFLRRNWWQVIFLAVPFLRVLRVTRLARLARAGRIASSAVRTSRTAQRRLGSRLAWLATVTLIVIVAASQVAFELGDYPSYGEALYEAALATITGEPMRQRGAGVRVLGVFLAVYSVVVFAALAGSLGAFFLERPDSARIRLLAAAESEAHGGGDHERHEADLHQ